MRNNPDQFIEIITEHSWLEYLTNMSRDGTWADHLIVQAVANALNLNIHMAESDPNFSEHTHINPLNMHNTPVDIFIAHVGEVHYDSTAQINQHCSASHQNQLGTDKTIISKVSTNTFSKSRKEYMRDYMGKRRADHQYKEQEKKREKVCQKFKYTV